MPAGVNIGDVSGKTIGEITEGLNKTTREILGKAKETIVRFGGKSKSTGTIKVKSYEQARNEALFWLEQRGFKSEKQTFGKFGYTRKRPIGRQTSDGKIGFRIEYDSRSGAHINLWSGKEKGPHIEFDASEKTVKKLQKLFK